MDTIQIQQDCFPLAPIVIWAIIRILWNLTRDEHDDDTKRIRRVHKPSAYLSNGKLIPRNHTVYYFNLLGLIGPHAVNDDDIRAAARRVREAYMPSWVDAPPTISDIKAARSFLLDQYYHITAYN